LPGQGVHAAHQTPQGTDAKGAAVSWLVDTNVLSEPTQKHPEAKVVAWLRQHSGEYYVSTVTVGELTYGIRRLPAGSKRRNLEAWLELTLDRLEGRVLAFNHRIACEWGALMAELEARGQKMPTADGQIAATARRHGLTVVTDNTGDFKQSGVRLLNPFL
jgi:predicted nucleic acid-binding protein